MSEHENISNNEVNLVMLRSDLTDVFRDNSDKIAIQQSEDLSQPAEIVLGGTYQNPNSNEKPTNVHLRQRIDKSGTDYLIIFGTGVPYFWFQISNDFAYRITDGERWMDANEIDVVRQLLQPHTTVWSAKDTQKWAALSGLYEMADKNAQRPE